MQYKAGDMILIQYPAEIICVDENDPKFQYMVRLSGTGSTTWVQNSRIVEDDNDHTS